MTPFSRGWCRILALDPADFRALLWAAGLWLAAALTTAALIVAGFGLPPLWAMLVLAVVATIAERQSVAVTDRIQMSVSFLPLIFAAVAFGPLAALLTGALSTAADFRRPYLRCAVYTPARSLTGAFAGFAAWSAGGHATGFGGYLLASFSGSVANLAADGLFNSLTLAIRKTGTARAFAHAMIPLFLIALPLYVPLVALFVDGYHAYSLWVVVAFFVPAVALQRLLHMYQEQRVAARSLATANARLERANLSFAAALVATLDARDRYTAGHSAAVAVYARDIAARLGLSRSEQQVAHLCGLVHDIGKIGLPAGLLEKPGSLTLDERRQMEEHSVIGERILRKVDDYAEIAAVVRHHHERVDGNGYPDRLGGEKIPLLARIIAVADAYNAMTSDRPYRDAMPSRVARLRLAQAVETQFDTTIVAAFEAILAGATEEYRQGIHADFAVEAAAAARPVAGIAAVA